MLVEVFANALKALNYPEKFICCFRGLGIVNCMAPFKLFFREHGFAKKIVLRFNESEATANETSWLVCNHSLLSSFAFKKWTTMFSFLIVLLYSVHVEGVQVRTVDYPLVVSPCLKYVLSSSSIF